MRKIINVSYDFGAEIKLKTEPDVKRIVTGWNIRPSGKMYECACGLETSWHQDVEMESYTEPKRIGGFGTSKTTK